MASSPHLFIITISSRFTHVLVFFLLIPQFTLSQLPNPPINTVTKHLSFPTFSPVLHHDIIKLLGSAKFSNVTGSIQIPDAAHSSDLKHLAGRALYSSPIRLFDPLSQTPASFHTTFSFQFTAAPEATNGGSGLAFIIVPDEFTVGRPGPWLAMLNDACDEDYKAVAVEFDTRKNAEFGDPNDNHVGINLGTIVSTAAINASDAGVYLKDGSVHRARIDYDGSRRWIEIRLGSGSGRISLDGPPIFSAPIDLSPHLNEYMFVGFSASTGNHTQIHHILDWNFSSTSHAVLQFPSSRTCEKKIFGENSSRKSQERGFMIFSAVVVLLLVVIINLYYNGKRRQPETMVEAVLPEKKQRPRPPNKPRRFTISEISSATRCFSEGEILGSGSRGVCYKGTLPNGSPVAINRLSTRFLHENSVDLRRIVKEIIGMTRIQHPNLMSLRGWCFDKKEIIVVYDYFPNGSLNRWLFGLGVLPWTRRVKALKDIADSLSFLHSKKLSHKNVKTSSVFMDLTFRAVLGDFGFGFGSIPNGPGRVDSVVACQRADVFGYGVVALETVAGRCSVGSDPGLSLDPDNKEKNMDLLEFAWNMHKSGELLKAVDPRIGPVFNPDQAIRILKVGLLCTVREAKARPSMLEVVGFLNMDQPIPEIPLSQPVSKFPYNSATDLCTGNYCTPFR